MKKSICIFLSALLCLFVCNGCGKQSPVSTTHEATQANPTEQQISVPATKTAKAKENSEMESILRGLLHRNYVCITELFYLGQLPCEDYDGGENTLVKVTSEKYTSKKDIADFLHTVYAEKEVDRLLNSYANNKPLYVEKEGVLYEDVSLIGGIGYNVNWDSYEIVISECTDTVCKFNVNTTEYDCAEKNDKSYTINCCAILEDGQWKLEQLVY